MPIIPNTTQNGMILQSVGDGQNSCQWSPPVDGFTVTDQTASGTPRFLYMFSIPDSLVHSFAEIQNVNGNAYVQVQNTNQTIIGGQLVEIVGGDGYSTNGYIGVQITANDNIDIYLTGGSQTSGTITIGNIIQVSETFAGSVIKLGFFGVAPVAQQVSGGTLTGVIAGLVALGLFSS